MRRGRIFFYLAFIVILGLVAVVLVWTRMGGQLTLLGQPAPSAAQPTPVISTVNVVVVSQKIGRGSAISADKLELIPIQQDLFYEGMFTNIAEVEGRLAKFDLEAGVPLTSGMLVDSAEQLSGTGSVAALSIPRGMVAVSVPINRLSAVSYAPRPGDHVNVIVTMMFVDLDPDFQSVLPNRNIGVLAPGTGTGSLTGTAGQTTGGGEQGGATSEDSGGTAAEIQTSALVAVSGGGGGLIGRATSDPILGQTFYQVPTEEQRPRMVTQNLLQDAVVLQVGNFSYQDEEAQPTPVPEQAEGQAAAAPPPPPDVITLIVTPQDAITLNYLLFSGARLSLALRASQDDTRVQTESVTLQFLLEQYNIAVPAKLPTGLQPAIRILTQPVLTNDIVPTPVP